MSEPVVSDDPAIIRAWAREALSLNLYRDDGVAQFIFRGQATIHRMAYLSGVAWVMCTDWPPPWERNSPRVMAFTRPDRRRQGIARMLLDLAWPGKYPADARFYSPKGK